MAVSARYCSESYLKSARVTDASLALPHLAYAQNDLSKRPVRIVDRSLVFCHRCFHKHYALLDCSNQDDQSAAGQSVRSSATAAVTCMAGECAKAIRCWQTTREIAGAIETQGSLFLTACLMDVLAPNTTDRMTVHDNKSVSFRREIRAGVTCL